MRCLRAVVVSVLMFGAGCGESGTPATPPATGGPAAGAPATPPVAPGADFSTPTKVGEAWAKACAAKDKDAIALCISPDTTDGDLKEIRAKTGSDRNYGELADFFGKAAVTSEKIDPSGDKAVVEVSSKRPERIEMVKKDGRWWIMDM